MPIRRRNPSKSIIKAKKKNAKHIERLRTKQQSMIRKWVYKSISRDLSVILDTIIKHRGYEPYIVTYTREFSKQEWLREEKDTIELAIQEELECVWDTRIELEIEQCPKSRGYQATVKFYFFEEKNLMPSVNID